MLIIDFPIKNQFKKTIFFIWNTFELNWINFKKLAIFLHLFLLHRVYQNLKKNNKLGSQHTYNIKKLEYNRGTASKKYTTFIAHYKNNVPATHLVQHIHLIIFNFLKVPTLKLIPHQLICHLNRNLVGEKIGTLPRRV